MIIKKNDTKLHVIILILDLIGSFFSFCLATLLRYNILLGQNQFYDLAWILLLIIIITTLVNIVRSPVVKFSRRGYLIELIDVLTRQIIVLVYLLLILYLVHGSQFLSRLVFIYYTFISITSIWLLRLLLKCYLLNIYLKGKASTKVLVIAEEKRLEKIKTAFSNNYDWDRVLCKAVATDKTSYIEILDYITHNEVDEVFISLFETKNKKAFQDFTIAIIDMGVRVNIDIEPLEFELPGYKWLDEVESFGVISISRNSISISRRFIKRTIDIIGGLVGMIILAVVSIFLIPIIKLDSKGPAFFKQKRVGKNGRIFYFYKFRSMCLDAENQKKKLMKQNEVTGLMFKIKDDPRITRVGRFIRKTSLDELPQFWNVLKGDMSLVGTRPPTLDEYEQYKPWQKARLSMKPGITGLWQVSGRSDIKDFSEVIKLDMKYIDNWSLSKDIKLLLKTVVVVFEKKGSR